MKRNKNNKFEITFLDGTTKEFQCLWAEDLSNANLQNVNLKYTSLATSDLIGANLEGADLEGANLENVDFTDANLRNANFTDANLRGVDFTDANLEGANLENACLDNITISISQLPFFLKYYTINIKAKAIQEGLDSGTASEEYRNKVLKELGIN